MEEVCERENCKQALRRVKANKGSPGIDRMNVEQLSGHDFGRWSGSSGNVWQGRVGDHFPYADWMLREGRRQIRLFIFPKANCIQIGVNWSDIR
jgi:hypothetical protein